MTAREVKEALRARHPATAEGMPGPWTCIEEWMNIDLLAVAAWASVRPYPRYARVGYEVKISRSDYKRELAKPYKRAAAVAFCHEFYFAVPHGLLKPLEVTWREPWGFANAGPPFERERCPGAYGSFCHEGHVTFGKGRGTREWRRRYLGLCLTCRGRGWVAESPAVRAQAPALWIPDDVGLIVVYPSGRTVIAKKAPQRTPETRFSDMNLGQLIRWISVRPDPRHTALRAVSPP